MGGVEIISGVEEGAKAIAMANQSGDPWLTLIYGGTSLNMCALGLCDIIGGFYSEESLGIQLQNDSYIKDHLKYVPDLPSPPIWRKETWPIPE
jgi:hypothetical protein